MTINKRILPCLFLVLLFVIGFGRLVFAGAPTEQIRSAVNQGVEVLQNTQLDSEKEKVSAIGRLREIVFPVFDFREMAKRSLGNHWRRISPQQQDEFVATFTGLLEKTYADKIDLYQGQKVAYTGESIDGNFALVNTRILGKDRSYAVDYRLQLEDGKWKVYDIVAENISLISNYRAQFNRILANSSFDDLMRRLKA